MNKLLPLLWSSYRGRRTALPSALNKHCGPTTTYEAALDVWGCRLEGRGVSRGVRVKEEPLATVAHPKDGRKSADPCRAVAKTRRLRRRSVVTVSVGKM